MEENRAQTKEKVHYRAFYASTRIGGPSSRSKSTQEANSKQINPKEDKKHTSESRAHKQEKTA
jgi:hypothetical protein